MAAVTLKELLPLHPRRTGYEPSLNRIPEMKGTQREQAVTTGQGGTAGSALGCFFMSWPKACSPLFSCLPVTNSP